MSNLTVPLTVPLSQSLRDAVNIALYGGAGAFSPASLFSGGEQGAWYDFSDLSTLFQDSAGTTPVTADGQSIGKVLDKSGRGNHLIQATGSLKPIYKTSGGLHWAEFDGVDDGWATAAAVNMAASATASTFLGIKSGSNAVSGIPMELGLGGAANSLWQHVPAPPFEYQWTISGSSANTGWTVNDAAYDAPKSAVIACNYNVLGADRNTQVIPRVNGITPPIAGAGAGTTGTGFVNTHTLFIGRRAAVNNPFTGNMHQIILLNRTTTAGEITNTETYIATKSGVTL